MRNKIIEDIDSIIKDFIEKSEVPGLAIGIIENDKVIYSKGFGVKSLETLEEITTDTIFHMASISKPFVATSIMQLVEKEKIELDDPIVKHLKYFKVKYHYYETITIRDIK